MICKSIQFRNLFNTLYIHWDKTQKISLGQNKRHKKCTLFSFKIKMIEQLHAVLLPEHWFLSCNKKFKNWISAGVGALQKLQNPWYELLNLENQSFEYVAFSQQ